MPLRPLAFALCSALLLGSAGCGGNGDFPRDDPQQPEPPPTPTPPPPPPPTPTPPPAEQANFNVEPCLIQVIRPGTTVAIQYIPDTLKLDFRQPSEFPNGRNLPDPVIDYTLAMLFVDLTRHPISVLHDIPLGPPANDRAFRNSFPWLASPNGNPPITSGGSAPYDFRTNPSSAYTRIDRMGMPAVATALISGNPDKNAYNDDNPRIDSSFKWVDEIQSTLKSLTDALADDFDRAGVTKCAKPFE